jgi:hypothetical protein
MKEGGKTMTPRSGHVAAATAALLFGILSPAIGEEATFSPLLNGKNLSGWTIVRGSPASCTVRDGVLEVSAPPKCWLRSEREYLNYVLRLEWRLMSAEANSGVFLCARDTGEEFPQCLEVQIYHKGAGAMFPIRKAVGGPTAMPWEERVKPPGQWNQFQIVVYNGCVMLAVNGHVVNQANILDPQIGHIGLQCETDRVQFRNLEIREIVDPLPDVRWGAGRRPGGKPPGKH